MAKTLIKRYANRKLYDTQRSCYVTLDEIRDMVKEGEDVRIVDNRTGNDLTSVTLTQIIYEEQKRSPSDAELPLGALRGIIQSGGAILSKLGSPVTRMGDDLKRRATLLEEGSQTAVREFVESAQRTFDDTQRRLDEGVRDALALVRRDSREASVEVEELQGRVRDLEREVTRLGKLVERLERDRDQERFGAATPNAYTNDDPSRGSLF